MTEHERKEQFGKYISEKRQTLGLTKKQCANLIGITPAYLSDIERGNRNAPTNHLNKIIEVLHIEHCELDAFYDLAGLSHGKWEDLNEMLNNLVIRTTLRLAKEKNINPNELLEFVQNYKAEENTKNL